MYFTIVGSFRTVVSFRSFVTSFRCVVSLRR